MEPAKFKVIDGSDTLYFNTEVERDAYINAKPKVWDKETYCEEVWRAHSEWYRKIYTRKPDFDYESKGEIAMYLEHPDEALRNQAKALTELWFDSVDLFYAHYDEVTEATANVNAFIQSLPTL